MDPLKMLRKLRLHKLQSKGRTDLHALRPPCSIALTEVTHHGVVMRGRIETRDLCRAGFQAFGTFRSQTPFLVYDHVKFRRVVMNDWRVHWAGFFTLTLLLGALGTDILDRFGGRE